MFAKMNKKQWINLPPQEDEDSQQFINLHKQSFDVKVHKALFIGLAWVKPTEQNVLSISRKLNVLILVVIQIVTNVHY